MLYAHLAKVLHTHRLRRHGTYCVCSDGWLRKAQKLFWQETWSGILRSAVRLHPPLYWWLIKSSINYNDDDEDDEEDDNDDADDDDDDNDDKKTFVWVHIVI